MNGDFIHIGHIGMSEGILCYKNLALVYMCSHT